MQILTEPKNALVRQYQRMFEIDGVELEFEKDALEAIADLAKLRQTGARGLRAILEEVLGPIMFEVPSSDEVARVVVTREAVLDNAAATIVPRHGRAAEPAERVDTSCVRRSIALLAAVGALALLTLLPGPDFAIVFRWAQHRASAPGSSPRSAS